MQGLQQLKRILSEQLLGGAGCDCQNWRSHLWGGHDGITITGPPQKPSRVRFDGRAKGAFEAAVMGHMQPVPRNRPKKTYFWGYVVCVVVAIVASVVLKRSRDAG
jgi:hypothetical protein